MKKYLVSVPIMARMEIYVDAENEEEAREKAWEIADTQDVKYINHELIEPIYFDDTIKKIEGELIEFGINEGYYVWDCKEEFGE